MPKESKKTKYDNIEVKTKNPLDNEEVETAEEIAAEAIAGEQEAAKEEKQRHKPIAQAGTVRQHKPGIIERWATGVLGPNGAKAIFHRITSDVIMPNIKVILADSVNAATDMALFGERRQKSGSNGARGTNVGRAQNYQNSYGNRNGSIPGVPRYAQRQRQQNGNWNNPGPGEPEQQVPDYSLQNRRDANDVLNMLIGDISRFGQVSVADYKDMLDIPSEFTDHGYGWTDLSMARVVQNFGGRGFTITLPPVEII